MKIFARGLMLAGFAGLLAVPSFASGIFGSSYNASLTFADTPLSDTTMTTAFDGTNYWASSGGSCCGTNLAEYDSSGNPLGTFVPGLDFRSVFTNASGQVFARQFADPTIYMQTSPGVFASTGVALNGGSLNPQASVVLNSAGTEYIAMDAPGSVDEWDLSGNYLGTVTLSGFVDGGYPSDRGVAAAGGDFLTYDNGTLDAWSLAGSLLGATTLNGAGSDFNSNFSLSYANGLVIISDGSTTQGYDVGLGSGASPVPEPGTLALLGSGFFGLAGAVRRRAGK